SAFLSASSKPPCSKAALAAPPASSWSRRSLGIAGSLRRDIGGSLFTHYARPHTEILTLPLIMRLANLKIRTKILLVAGAPTLMALVVGAVALSGFSQTETSAKWVDHTTEVLESATSIVAAAVNMETGMRGFAISGEDAFLDPYLSGKATFDET